MPLFRDLGKIGPREKAAWTLLMFLLLGLELRSLYRDRHEHDAEQAQARCAQLRSFQSIADGINQSISQSEKQFEATTKGISREIDTFTGGHSFAYIDYSPDSVNSIVTVVHKGNYPLYEVNARITDLDKISQNMLGQTIHIPDLIQHHATMLPRPQILPFSADHLNLNIFFQARNGDWLEQLRERKVGSKWVRAMRIRGQFTSLKKETIECENIDADFPRNSDGAIDKDFGPPSTPKPPSCW